MELILKTGNLSVFYRVGKVISIVPTSSSKFLQWFITSTAGAGVNQSEHTFELSLY